MTCHDMLYDGEAKTGTALFTGPRFVHPVKSFKNTLERLGWNTRAVVFDRYFNLVAVDRPRAD